MLAHIRADKPCDLLHRPNSTYIRRPVIRCIDLETGCVYTTHEWWNVINVQDHGSTMMVKWLSNDSDVTIEIMDAQGGIVARIENAAELHHTRSPNNDALHIVVRAPDGNVLAKRSC